MKLSTREKEIYKMIFIKQQAHYKTIIKQLSQSRLITSRRNSNLNIA